MQVMDGPTPPAAPVAFRLPDYVAPPWLSAVAPVDVMMMLQQKLEQLKVQAQVGAGVCVWVEGGGGGKMAVR